MDGRLQTANLDVGWLMAGPSSPGPGCVCRLTEPAVSGRLRSRTRQPPEDNHQPEPPSQRESPVSQRPAQSKATALRTEQEHRPSATADRDSPTAERAEETAGNTETSQAAFGCSRTERAQDRASGKQVCRCAGQDSKTRLVTCCCQTCRVPRPPANKEGPTAIFSLVSALLIPSPAKSLRTT